MERGRLPQRPLATDRSQARERRDRGRHDVAEVRRSTADPETESAMAGEQVVDAIRSKVGRECL
jgi:hypothetical protein